MPTSLSSSLKMLRSEAGKGVTSFETEKAKPSAWPGVGYGSCPMMTTEIESMEVLNARITFSYFGAVSKAFNVVSIKSIWPRSSLSASCQSGCNWSNRLTLLPSSSEEPS